MLLCFMLEKPSHIEVKLLTQSLQSVNQTHVAKLHLHEISIIDKLTETRHK